MVGRKSKSSVAWPVKLARPVSSISGACIVVNMTMAAVAVEATGIIDEAAVVTLVIGVAEGIVLIVR